MGIFRLLDIDTEETSSSIALKFAKWTKKVKEVGDGLEYVALPF